MGQNGFQRGPKGSNVVKKGVNLYQNALNWVPSGLKWHQHPLKWVKSGPKCGPEGSHVANWPQIPQNTLFQAKFAYVLTGEGPPSTPRWVEIKLGPLSGGYSGSVHDFCPKVYIG